MFNIYVYRQYFLVLTTTPKGRNIMDIFSKKFQTFKMSYNFKTKKSFKELDKVYLGIAKHLGEYRIPISLLDAFIGFLNTFKISEKEIFINNEETHKGDDVTFNMAGDMKPRDYQEKYINYLTSNDERNTKLLNLATGLGKGFISIYSLHKIGKKTAIILLPKYIEKWVEELTEITDLVEEDILVIRGGRDLRYVMNANKEDIEKYKIFIFSNRTLYFYIKEYEGIADIDDFSYDILPQELMEHLGVANILVDEVHQEFYSNFKFNIYFNVNLFIGLSATLVNSDKKLELLYRIIFPFKNRIEEKALNKYINVYSVSYNIKHLKRIRYESPGMGYSQTMFEKSILRNSDILENYLEMIYHYVKVGYLDRRKKGDKLAIYAGAVKMCSTITEYLSERIPDLDIRRYVNEDPYENIIEPDIRVTTAISAGTAIDIPGLITVLQTINIKSLQANIQNIGRLREKKDREMRYYYLWSKDIKRHYEYHKFRQKIFRPKAKNLFFEHYNKTI